MPMLPALTRFYGLRPWDFDRMTFAEVDEYIEQFLDEMKRREREAASGT